VDKNMNNNSDNRNFIRNLVAKAANRQFSGNQRIVTGRDSMAFNESTGAQRPVAFSAISLNGVVGTAQAGE